MQIRCPHCHHAVEIVEESSFKDVECPSCGSQFSIVGDDPATETHRTQTRTLGHFELIERLGVGAFGSVWKAKDTKLDRVVAVKIPRKEQLDEQEAELFLRDARAAAQLKHANIVGIHEVGKDDGTIYIAMDYIDGADLQDWMRGQPLPPEEAAELMAKIADAVHQAHQKGVIHRDLKPSNIMLDRKGEPHIMDFGLAKRESGEITMTVDGATLGTPAYMSPEQAAGKAHEADARSDVYSLGVVIYEMLTGTRPFHGEKRMLIVQVVQDEPPALRKLNRRIPRDLESICLKCLEKSADRRYQTAQELAEDLKRHLDGEQTLARPISNISRFHRWCRRHPARAGLLATTSLTLAAVLVLSVVYSFQIKLTAVNQDLQETQAALRTSLADTRKLQQSEAEASERLLYSRRVSLAYAAWRENQIVDAERLLEKCPKKYRNWEWSFLDRLVHPDLRVLQGPSEIRNWINLLRTGLVNVAVSRDGGLVAAPDLSSNVFLWDVATGERKVLRHQTAINAVSFSNDTRKLVTAGVDGTATVWDLSTATEAFRFEHEQMLKDAVFSQGNDVVTIDASESVRVWDLATGNLTRSLPLDGNLAQQFVSPDGGMLAGTFSSDLNSTEVRLRLSDLSSGKSAVELVLPFRLKRLVFSRDSKLVATCDHDGSIAVWSTGTGKQLGALQVDEGEHICMDFGPQEHELFIASGEFSQSTAINLWNVRTGELKRTMKGSRSALSDIKVVAGGERLVSRGVDGSVRIWDAKAGQERLELQLDPCQVLDIAFSPNGDRLAAATGVIGEGFKDDSPGNVVTWDLDPLIAHRTVGPMGYYNSVSFSSDGRLIASGSNHGNVIHIWNASDGDEFQQLSGGFGDFVSVHFNDSGMLLASGRDQEIVLWDAVQGRIERTLRGHTADVGTLSFNSGSDMLASGGVGFQKLHTTPLMEVEDHDVYGEFSVWDLTAERRILSRTEESGVLSVRFAPNRAMVAVSLGDGTITLWDVPGNRQVGVIESYGSIVDIAFSPDGLRLAGVSGDNREPLRLWDVETGNELLSLPADRSDYLCVAFSTDGQLLAAGTSDGRIHLWNAGPMPAAVTRHHGR